MKWVKRDPDAALAGMVELTLEERGAYNTLLDLLYSRDGKIANNDRFMARACNCNPRTWRRVRDQLIAKGKIWITEENLIGAKRVERTLNEARMMLERTANARQKALEIKARASQSTDGQPQPQRKKDAADAAKRETEGRVGNGHSLPSAASAPVTPEAELFQRGKEILGPDAGGMIKRLLVAKGSSVPLARAALEMASTKGTPREYIGAIINRPGGVGKVHNSPYV